MTRKWTVKTPKKKRGLWWKVLLAVTLLLGIGLYVLSQYINAAAQAQVNKALGRFLSQGGTVASVTIEWQKGQIDVRGLKIHRPEGYGKSEVLTLEHLLLNYDLLSLFTDNVLIDELSINGLSLQSERDNNGHFSFEKLLLDETVSDAEQTEITSESAPLSIPSIHIDKLRLNNISLTLIDHQLQKDWAASLNIVLSVDDLHITDMMNYDLSAGAIDIKITDVVLQQLKGGEANPMFKLDTLELASAGVDTRAGELKIQHLLLDQLKASFERNTQGVTNAEMLVDAWFPEGAHSKASMPSTTVDQAELGQVNVDESKGQVKLPTLIIDDVKLTSIAVEWLSQINAQMWRSGFDDLDILLTDVALDNLGQSPKALGSLDISLKNVAIDQFPGAATQKFLTVKQSNVSAGQLDLTGKALVITEVTFDDVQSTVTLRKGTPTNVERLITALFGASSDGVGQQAGEGGKTTAGESSMPAILIEQVRLSQGIFNYYDEILTQDRLHFLHENIELSGKQVRFFEPDTAIAPATIDLTFKMPQLVDLPDAYFAGYANMGPINEDVPMLNAQARLVGFKLDSLGSLVSPTMRSALGVDGFDSAVSLELDADEIELEGIVVTDKNIRYDSIRVEGPLASPQVTVGAIFSKLYGRVFDGLKNIGIGGLSAGGEIAKGGVNVAKEVGGGVVDVGKSIGKGLFDIGSGVATLNPEKVSSGFSETTIGSVDSVVNSAKDAGSAASSGVSDSAGHLSAGKQKEAWDAGIPARYQEAMKDAEKKLAAMPYPPKMSIRHTKQAPKFVGQPTETLEQHLKSIENPVQTKQQVLKPGQRTSAPEEQAP